MVQRGVVMVVCALLLTLAAQPAAADDKKAVGAYLFKFTGVEAFFGPGAYVPGLATLHSDGTLSSVTGSDESGPSTVFAVKNSAVHGSRTANGPRGVRASALYLNFNPIGFPVGGEVVAITRLRIEAEFDKDFNSGSGVFFDSVYVCPTFVSCPDPLTSAPTIPEPAAGRPFTVHRIR